MSDTSSTIGSEKPAQTRAPRKPKPYIVCNVQLDENQLTYLRMRYPSYDFNSSRSPQSHDHPVSHVIRVVEGREITRDPTLRYVDIGGKPCRYADRASMKVHCCMPILSGEDEIRQSKMKVPAHVSVCNKKGEDCHEPADQLISVDVLYFQTPETVAQAMVAHGCKSYIATVNNVFDGSGYLNNGEVYYTVKNGQLVQTNLETGNTYVHGSLDWVWTLNNYEYEGRYLNAELTKRSPDRVRIEFTLTRLPNLVKKNLDMHKYRSVTFTTWRNQYTGTRTYSVDGSHMTAYDDQIVKFLVTKHLNTKLEELAPQLLTEVKNIQLRGYHMGKERCHVNIPYQMFKTYVLIAKEEILNQRLNLGLADKALDELTEACRTVGQHRHVLVERFRRYLQSWYLFKTTSNPEDHPGLNPDLWRDRTPELLRAHTVPDDGQPGVLEQTHFECPKNDAKEEYLADDGMKLTGPQPAGTTLYVPTQNMEELRIAMKTRADKVPDEGTEEQHKRRLEVFDRYLLRGRSFEEIHWTMGAFYRWVAKYPADKQQRYIDVVKARLEGVEDNLDAMRPEHRELTIRDLFVKMEALYKIHDEGTELEVKPRLIISSHEMVNLYYGPIVDMVKSRFKTLLAGSPLPLHYTDGNTPQENANLFTRAYDDGMDIAENDYSKYDSTQGKWIKETEFEVYKALGLVDTDLATWRRTTSCKYTSRKYGFKATVLYQRQTGDPTTSLGNSIVNLLVSLDAYLQAGVDLLDMHLMMVLGDDNLALFPGGTLTGDRIGLIEGVNASCGLKAKYKVGHDPHLAEYCSTVFIRTQQGFASCPKPGKAIARLNVRSKFHPSVSDESYAHAKRFAYWLANSNNPIGRVLSDLYARPKHLEASIAAKAYNVYETDRLKRMYGSRHLCPQVTDEEFRTFCQDRYGSMNIHGTAMVVREMCRSDELRVLELDDLTKEMVRIDQ